jgi:nucleoside-diphosphate-sugar epimerase
MDMVAKLLIIPRMTNHNSSDTQSTKANAKVFANSRFLVTGAKGFIGSWVVKNLVERGDYPWIFDLDSKAHRLQALLTEEQIEQIPFVQGDITRKEDVERVVADNGITHIIHLAALQVPACAANPIQGAKVNVLGTLNVFETVKQRRDLVKSLVYASSAAVFGPEEMYGPKVVPEGAPLQPTTHYGVFKQANEGNAKVYFADDGISSCGLRPWAVYGVGRDQGITSGPTKAIKAAIVGRPYTIRFTGGLDLQYVKDTAEIFLRCAEAGFTGARLYTLRGSVTQVSEFLKVLGDLLPKSRNLVKAEGSKLHMAYDLGDSDLVRDLQHVPRTPLETGIRETMELFERLYREGRLSVEDLNA